MRTPLLVLAVTVGLLAAPIRAQDLTADDLGAAAAQLLQEYGGRWIQPSREDWQQFWNLLHETLQSQSVEDFDHIRPYAETAVVLLRLDPNTRGYADWLQQRMDYFEMASLSMQPAPSLAQPLAPPAKIPGRKPGVAPAPRPKAAPAPPQVQTRRLATVRDAQTWKAKLGSRPAPKNAAALIPRLKSIFQQQGVPPQWVWQAEVESSLNPAARSPVGAVGLYQFMPATARRFGMETAPTDDRLVPEKSAHAAARYLKFLHRQFGSWPLAFAAYNAGEGRIARALKNTSNKTFEGIRDSLALETQMYVPKIMATVSLREGVDAARLPPPSASLGFRRNLLMATWLPGN